MAERANPFFTHASLPGERAHASASGHLLVQRSVRKIKQTMACQRNRLYVAYEKSVQHFSDHRHLRILMSEKPEWREAIQKSFNGSRCEVEFGSISRENAAGFDVVVPMEIPDLAQARQSPQLLAKNPLPLPSEKCVQLCDDKYKFAQALIDKGFGNYIPRISAGLKPPYILKKRIGCAGLQCWVIRDREDELQVQDKLNDPEYFCQEIIRGRREFATHILFTNGRIAKSLNIMYVFEGEVPIKGPDGWLYRVVHRCPHLGLFADILKAIGFQGLCCVNYKEAHGRPYILEINPRFGGSLAPYFFSFVRHLH